ncbi:MAG: caspase family protein [Chitinophagaceae bacterium]|nr:caspase family protein [Chitinophagaceae bacterium]
MKLRSRLIAIFILFFSTANAQSFYEMFFHFGSGAKGDYQEYSSFYLLNDDGTGMMRISYKGSETEKGFILDCELTQGFPKGKNGVVNYDQTYFTGKNFFVIEGDGKDTTADFPPISFWFKYDKEKDVYVPWKVTTKDQNNKPMLGVIDGDIRLLEDKDLTRELVLTYFTKDEEIYKNLFQTNIRSLPPDLKSSKMYLLTVIDNEDESIGGDCETDRKKQQSYFTKLAGKLEIPIEIKEVLGKELGRDNVLKKIDEIKATKNDIVIFYYSGHGYSREDNHLFPYLDLRPDKDIPIKKGEGELNMEEIYDIVKAKPSRLNLVISDCCNWHPSVSNARSSNIANTRPSPVGLSVENMRSLFMNPNRLSILMTAAAKGQVSAGNSADGGIFTTQFRDALQKFMSITYQNVSWQQITENVQLQTATTAGYSDCPQPENAAVIKPCRQTPMFKIN